MVFHVVLGLDIPPLRLGKLEERGALFHGDYKSPVNLSQIAVSESDTVMLATHGGCSNDGKHQINLYSSLNFESGLDYTSYNLQKLKQAGDGKPVNVELFSCHGGAAINDIVHLPIGSTLITMTSSQDSMFAKIINHLIEESASFTDPTNPFKRYLSYLCINADTNSIAINTKNGAKIFTSSIDDLQDFSIDGIKAWQVKQIGDFNSFTTDNIWDFSAKLQANSYANPQLNMKQQIEKWCNQFDTKVFREMLLTNAIERSDTGRAIKVLIECHKDQENFLHEPAMLKSIIKRDNYILVQLLKLLGSDFNVRFENGMTPLAKAIDSKKSMALVRELLEGGARVNDVIEGGYTPLMIALEKEDFSMLNLLFEKGAEVNQKNDQGYAALSIVVDQGSVDKVKFLIERGANLEPYLLEWGVEQRNFEMVKILLSAGIDAKSLVIEDATRGTLAIRKAIELYNASPVNYIITNNQEPEDKIRALKNLSVHADTDRVKSRCSAIIQVEELRIEQRNSRESSGARIELLSDTNRKKGVSR